MELLYCHLTKAPTPVHEHRPEVPRILSSLVAKLLEKTAEARYQHAASLAQDLETCLARLDGGAR